MSSNGFFDYDPNAAPESGVFTSGSHGPAMVSGKGSPRLSNFETGGFMRVTMTTAKQAEVEDKDRAFREQMAALPNDPTFNDVEETRYVASTNPAYGDLQPRTRSGLPEVEINENSIINLPGINSTMQVKSAMVAGFIGKTLDGKYVLNYNPEQYEPGYNQRMAQQHQQRFNRPQQTPQAQPQASHIADPVEHVGRILHGMGLDAPGILQQLSNKDHGGLMQALDLVKRGDSSKFIALLTRGLK